MVAGQAGFILPPGLPPAERMSMATNDQYLPGQAPFGMPDAIAGTGAPGSPGATEADAMADTAFRVPVTAPYMSVQNTDPPMAGVGADDTGVPGQNREGISGLGPSDLTQTGAGMGSTTARHPNSAARPS
jgi:hypothetical protein